jgi:hypothetical protein
MQSITGFFTYYSKPLVINLLNDEKVLASTIDFTDETDVRSLRLIQCLRQAEADVSLYVSDPDFSDTYILNIVNDFAMEYIYQRIAVVPVPQSIKDTCDKHRENLLLINQQKLDAFALTLSVGTGVTLYDIEETVLFDYD